MLSALLSTLLAFGYRPNPLSTSAAEFSISLSPFSPSLSENTVHTSAPRLEKRWRILKSFGRIGTSHNTPTSNLKSSVEVICPPTLSRRRIRSPLPVQFHFHFGGSFPFYRSYWGARKGPQTPFASLSSSHSSHPSHLSPLNRPWTHSQRSRTTLTPPGTRTSRCEKTFS